MSSVVLPLRMPSSIVSLGLFWSIINPSAAEGLHATYSKPTLSRNSTAGVPSHRVTEGMLQFDVLCIVVECDVVSGLPNRQE